MLFRLCHSIAALSRLPSGTQPALPCAAPQQRHLRMPPTPALSLPNPAVFHYCDCSCTVVGLSMTPGPMLSM